MRRIGPAFFVSLLLHIGLAMLALWTYRPAAKLILSSSVPVELVSNIPASEQVKTPVDEQAVKPPESEPEPEPELAPPEPQPKPEPKPEPKPVIKPDPKTTPVKDGLKKPIPAITKPAQKPGLDLNALSKPQNITSKTRPRTQAQASPQLHDGNAQMGSAQQDMGPIINAVTAAVQRNWAPCHVAGADHIVVTISFTLSRNGLVTRGPEWKNPNADPDAQQAASLAKLSIKKGEPYTGLPDGAYNQSYDMAFNPKAYCKNR